MSEVNQVFVDLTTGERMHIDYEVILEDIMHDLGDLGFICDDGDINYDNQEYWIDIIENNDMSVDEFVEWYQTPEWAYEVDRHEKYDWGLRVYLKF